MPVLERVDALENRHFKKFSAPGARLGVGENPTYTIVLHTTASLSLTLKFPNRHPPGLSVTSFSHTYLILPEITPIPKGRRTGGNQVTLPLSFACSNGFVIMSRNCGEIGKRVKNYMLLNGTVAPWLIGGFAVLALAMLAQTLKAWREAKRSPYFFLRVQAQKRLRQYSTSALVLISLATATAAYGWEQPQDETPRVAILVNNKPDTAISNTITQATDEPAPFLILDPTSSLIDRPAPGDTPPTTITSTESAVLLLPTEYNQVASTASLQDDTMLGTLFFSTAVDDQYKAINPGRTYSEGFFTLYGTFDYDGMEMAWPGPGYGCVMARC